jgi:hypothetical protein
MLFPTEKMGLLQGVYTTRATRIKETAVLERKHEGRLGKKPASQRAVKKNRRRQEMNRWGKKRVNTF